MITIVANTARILFKTPNLQNILNFQLEISLPELQITKTKIRIQKYLEKILASFHLPSLLTSYLNIAVDKPWINQ